MEWTNLIPWSISLVSLIIVIVAFVRNGKKDIKQEYVEDASKIDGIKESLLKANMKLDQVCTVTNETRSDIKAMNENLNAVEKRVSVLELRLDSFETQMKQLEVHHG